MSRRFLVLRGIGAGIGFALALLLIECLWMPEAALLVSDGLPLLVVEYVGLGAVLGLPSGVALALLPPRWTGLASRAVGLPAYVALIVASFALIGPACAEVPRHVYLTEVFGAWLLTAISTYAWHRFAPRLAVSRLWGRISPHWPSLGIGALGGLAGVLALRAASASQTGVTAPEGSTPNVVLIVIDTVRRDHLSAYGYSRHTSPSFDRLAAEGVRYDRAFTPTPSTLPAHASLFTGLYPSQHGADYRHTRLDPGPTTLAEVLAAHGYQTAGFVANPMLSSFTGIDRGFRRYDYVGNALERLPLLINLLLPPSKDQGGELVTRRMIDWMARAHARRQPFFAFANYLEVHAPYGTVPEEFRAKFLESPIAPTAARRWLADSARFFCTGCAEGTSHDGMYCEASRWHIESARARQMSELYDAGVSYVDSLLGEVQNTLERWGILDDTLFIVTSDHGELLGEQGRVGHGVFLHGATLSVPLAIRYPALFPAGTTVSAPVSLLDILPTVAEAVGYALAPSFPGQSLISSASLLERSVRAEESPFHPEVVASSSRSLGCDLRLTEARRLSLERNGLRYVWSSNGDQQLFDLRADPREELDLAERRAELLPVMHSELFDWYASVRSNSESKQQSQMDERTKRQLGSLGYLQSP